MKDCETVVFVGGISPQLEGEEMPIEISGFKENMIEFLKEFGKSHNLETVVDETGTVL